LTLYDDRYSRTPGIYGDVSGIPQQTQERKALAQRLLLDSQRNPLQGQMISGHYVAPSWTQQLARLVQGYGLNKEINDADKKLGDYNNKKRQDIAAILSGQSPQAVTTQKQEQYLPAYEPSQMDRFGSPTVPREMQTRTVESARTETPEEVQARLRPMIYAAASQYGNDPALQLMLGDLNYGRQRADAKADLQDTRQYSEGREAVKREQQLQDVANNQEFQRIMLKEQQGFQTTQQEKQFAQQYQMMKAQQGFQAQQQANSQNFQASNRAPVMVQGPDGKPVYVSAGDAVGQTPYVKQSEGKVNPAQQRVNDATDVLGILDRAEPLIDTATGSVLGNMVDAGQRLYGGSNQGAEASAQLKALEGLLVSKMPKMSGPQSDKDVLLYKQMAGQIGDPTIPAAQKRAAMKTIRELNQQYSGQQVDSPSSGVKKYNPKTGRIE
jgi:hypothetical protein